MEQDGPNGTSYRTDATGARYKVDLSTYLSIDLPHPIIHNNITLPILTLLSQPTLQYPRQP